MCVRVCTCVYACVRVALPLTWAMWCVSARAWIAVDGLFWYDLYLEETDRDGETCRDAERDGETWEDTESPGETTHVR